MSTKYKCKLHGPDVVYTEVASTPGHENYPVYKIKCATCEGIECPEDTSDPPNALPSGFIPMWWSPWEIVPIDFKEPS